MQGRVVRRLIVVLVIVSGAGAAFLASRIQQTYENLVATQLAVTTSLDQLSASVAEIGPAEQAYLIPGQPLRSSIARVEMLTRQTEDAASAIRPRLHSPAAAAQLQALANTLDNLRQIDARIRENLLNDDAAAADVVEGDAREAIASMVATVRTLQSDEMRNGAAERAALAQQGWALVGSVAALWTLALLLLARAPKQPAPPLSLHIAPEPIVDSEPADLIFNDSAAASPALAEVPAPAVDLLAAADICTAISRATSSDALPDVLARAAVVLDASGIILWMGAGDELFAISGYGYDHRLLARLGPIGREANNATAAAWRDGQLGTVAGDMMSNGAIVAPMFGVDTCVGVLAAEIRHGRESDVSTRAVTAMFAAQFATVVAAWPPPDSIPTVSEVGGASTDALPASI